MLFQVLYVREGLEYLPPTFRVNVPSTDERVVDAAALGMDWQFGCENTSQLVA